MSIARSISRTSGVIVFLVFLGCVAAAATAFVLWASERFDFFTGMVVSHYDEFAPTVTFRNGRASISQQQPYFIGGGPMDGMVLVIDTRPDAPDPVQTYLEKAPGGAVLTADRIIVKNANQIRIVPLKKFPNMVLNGSFLEGLVREYRPTVMKVLTASALVYFFLVKLFQALIFALVPLIIASSRKVTVTYGQAFKLAIFALIPPIALDVALDFVDFEIKAEWALYVVLYVVVLVLASLNLTKAPEPVVSNADTPITP